MVSSMTNLLQAYAETSHEEDRIHPHCHDHPYRGVRVPGPGEPDCHPHESWDPLHERRDAGLIELSPDVRHSLRSRLLLHRPLAQPLERATVRLSLRLHLLL